MALMGDSKTGSALAEPAANHTAPLTTAAHVGDTAGHRALGNLLMASSAVLFALYQVLYKRFTRSYEMRGLTCAAVPTACPRARSRTHSRAAHARHPPGLRTTPSEGAPFRPHLAPPRAGARTT